MAARKTPCPDCRKWVSEDNPRCRWCGHVFETPCPSCRKWVREDSPSCRWCGHVFAEENEEPLVDDKAAAATSSPAPLAPSRAAMSEKKGYDPLDIDWWAQGRQTLSETKARIVIAFAVVVAIAVIWALVTDDGNGYSDCIRDFRAEGALTEFEILEYCRTRYP